MRNDFAIFILTYGRPNKVLTYDSLKRSNYKGKIYFCVSDDDKTLEEYKKNFGEDRVLVFNKSDIKSRSQMVDNFKDGVRDNVVFFARNFCWEVAPKLGLNSFLQLDDDYTTFMYRMIVKGKLIGRIVKDMNWLCNLYLDFLEKTPPNVKSIALAQGGDYIGGKDNSLFKEGNRERKRKVMNSFFCTLEKPFKFIGRINEDVNTYTYEQRLSSTVFLTNPLVCLTQQMTQTNSGGMTETYLDGGTYIKSFYSVILSPSAISVKMMGNHHRRLHHRISWNNVCPVIIRENYKK